MTFIYWCVNSKGIKSNFRSAAVLDVGLQIPDENGETTVIVAMDVDRSISIYEDAIDYALERMMR